MVYDYEDTIQVPQNMLSPGFLKIAYEQTKNIYPQPHTKLENPATRFSKKSFHLQRLKYRDCTRTTWPLLLQCVEIVKFHPC